MRENFIDEQENIQNNNINDEDEKVPLIKEKNKIISSITIKIEKNLNEEDDNKKDDKKENEEVEEEEYPKRFEIGGEQDIVTIIKTKLQTHLV